MLEKAAMTTFLSANQGENNSYTVGGKKFVANLYYLIEMICEKKRNGIYFISGTKTAFQPKTR